MNESKVFSGHDSCGSTIGVYDTYPFEDRGEQAIQREDLEASETWLDQAADYLLQVIISKLIIG